ncbi:S8 family serine peptidase [Dactylosporangium aurantiacum]|uniref:S8 family serine peptidase n=1 Tax=Dactylosporangium aurantiacum TaxID=35754 RepID=UPI0009DD499D|nr:S8 family serine peptidase [Dactylosporangium aurantiacum]
MNIGRRLRAAVATAVAVPAGLALTGGPASAVVSSADTTAGATTLAQVRSVIGADTGTAATLTGKGVGVALIDTGVASVPGLPAAQIVNGPTATGAVDVSQMIAALDWVVQHRNDDPANPIRVLNLSYGSGGSGQSWTDPLQFAVERAWKAGIVVVAAAGNNGNAAGTLTNPATDDWVLAVGATATNGTTATGDDTLATFTNLASTTTAGVAGQVDLLAPGTSIASLRVPGSNVDNLYPSARVGETLFKGSGTSQATAVVSAAAALLLQAKPAATPNQVKDWLIKGATALGTGTAKTLGLAELNVNGALARTGTTVTPPALQASSGAGSLQGSRGTSYLTLDGVKLTGERTVWGPFSSIQWAAATSWSGGLWLGYRLAGDGWTGTSWASKTWAAGTWSAAPWAGSAATGWSDPAWSGRTWSGRTWSAGTWSGRTWSSDGWSATAWS